jgi:hypothetical protein
MIFKVEKVKKEEEEKKSNSSNEDYLESYIQKHISSYVLFKSVENTDLLHEILTIQEKPYVRRSTFNLE